MLELAVLAVIAKGETYGYEILSTLEASGLDGVGDASVYGTLRRLERAKYLESHLVPSDSGPARKYYAITRYGSQQLEAGSKTWARISGALDGLLDS